MLLPSSISWHLPVDCKMYIVKYNVSDIDWVDFRNGRVPKSRSSCVILYILFVHAFLYYFIYLHRKLNKNMFINVMWHLYMLLFFTCGGTRVHAALLASPLYFFLLWVPIFNRVNTISRKKNHQMDGII